MKITDLCVELENIQTTNLSEQEADEVFGGSNLKKTLSSLAQKAKQKKVLSSLAKALNSQKSTGVPGEGGIYDPSCW